MGRRRKKFGGTRRLGLEKGGAGVDTETREKICSSGKSNKSAQLPGGNREGDLRS